MDSTSDALQPAPQAETVLVTGVAGFIGHHVAMALLDRGMQVIGIDNLNDYYPAALKKARLHRLSSRPGFSFHQLDIADHKAMMGLSCVLTVDVVIHLAAQAGVRYSLENPFAYASANLVGHLSVLEFVRHAPKRPLLVYASSSSVYGANTKVPFSETDPVDHPVSLYAATKRADELMSESYARLYGMKQVGLRFFTVYGPWGRPDMAYWSFAEKIMSGDAIPVFNHGKLQRDFTYIDDIVSGVVATALQPITAARDVPHRIYNIGNNTPVELLHFIGVLEHAIGRKAQIEWKPMQPGDVHSTYADVSALESDYGFAPRTPLDVGIPLFVEWFRNYVDKKPAD